MPLHHVRIIGTGRAGASFAGAFGSAGLEVELLGRPDLPTTAEGTDLVLLCVPDDAIAEVAATIDAGDAAIAHCSGSRTLDVLAPHERRASIHPLMSLPDADTGAARLRDGCHFAVAGDPVAAEAVEALDGIGFEMPDADRARYHATASIAANHLVVLCAQVDRLARDLAVPPAAFWRLMATTLDNVAASSPAAALTGPAARGDWATIASHLDALGEAEGPQYRLLAGAAAELAGRNWPEGL